MESAPRNQMCGRGDIVSAPKCTSWLGHKFEARYSTEPPAEDVLAGLEGNAALVVNELLKTMSKRTYEADICVRCGFVVEHKTDKSSI